MSMNAKFVQVSSAQLAGLLEDPDSVEALFSNGGGMAGSGGLSRLSEVMNERIQKLGPQVLAQAMERTDPRLREALNQRLEALGIDPAALAKGQGGEVLLQLIGQQRASMTVKVKGVGAAAKSVGSISIEKAWHGVHYLLCGSATPGSSLASQAILGGDEIGEDFSGYGAARYFDSTKVAQVAAELARAGLETEMTVRFDPAVMTRLEIYPAGWEPNSLSWLLDAFHTVRDFYSRASSQGAAVVTVLE